jgi:hypothetical protein
VRNKDGERGGKGGPLTTDEREEQRAGAHSAIIAGEVALGVSNMCHAVDNLTSRNNMQTFKARN